MLFLILVVSAVCLVIANLLAFLKVDTTTRVVGVGVPLGFGGLCLGSVPLLAMAAVLGG
jgi:hypothetical protein